MNMLLPVVIPPQPPVNVLPYGETPIILGSRTQSSSMETFLSGPRRRNAEFLRRLEEAAQQRRQREEAEAAARNVNQRPYEPTRLAERFEEYVRLLEESAAPLSPVNLQKVMDAFAFSGLPEEVRQFIRLICRVESPEGISREQQHALLRMAEERRYCRREVQAYLEARRPVQEALI